MSEILAAIVGGLAASIVGFILGSKSDLLKSRTARRLDWCEKAMAQILSSAGELTNAIAADHAHIQGTKSEEAWTRAFQSLGELRRLEIEAEAYATSSSAEAITEALGDVIATSTAASKIRDLGRSTDATRMFEITLRLMYHAASRLAADIREELRESPASREWRLYDREIRDLRTELAVIDAQHDAR